MGKVLDLIAANGVVAILRGIEPARMVPLGGALLAAGVGAIEVTMNSDGAPEAITALRRELGEVMPVGAGTVMDGEAAHRAVDAGAMFLLTPHLAEDTLAAAIALGVPAVVGAMTPTEAVRAYSLGAEMVKIFPAGTLGANYFRELRGPLPHIRTMAVGGVNAANAADFIKAGAAAVGAGSQLIDQAAVRSGDWEAVRSKAAAMVAAVKSARNV
ncbi:bifunctional 4-hydroxy-2-oxoglutarate aldolase/2-dehydro-3-deoxy-phosphogluconate aldolase [Anaeroselena agilis]|uniref:Bifunctional 4-hydroxy-2-oxoglutarate aldolase/2-dehydro-3-deoxy-phosphogluconate aldolase n=1 Tax=Anaeroselena agilis TaxID=3063788 RepID=A0ABU3NSU4_9FIRM|nr:bifunctional 4-hydroxy-2-oxoglutarate aldolase/2-dehydro-3-deoxy-phosphogluconate aldolase [Selenomonadales bacterium 4137-cl]